MTFSGKLNIVKNVNITQNTFAVELADRQFFSVFSAVKNVQSVKPCAFQSKRVSDFLENLDLIQIDHSFCINLSYD